MKLFHGLHFNNVRGDIYGGLTAAIVALPLALAFGVSSGAGPVAGMYGAIFVGFFAALFGGTPSQVSGPTGPMTVVMAAIFTKYTAMYPADPAAGAALAFTVVVMGGLFLILFGLLRIGKYINLIPHPVVSGFMSGIGVIIILLQIGPLLGHVAPSKPLLAAQAVPGFVSDPVRDASLLGLLSLAIVYLTPSRIGRLVPPPLLALAVGTLALYLFTGGDVITQEVGGKTVSMLGGATVLGPIPTGFPSFRMPVIEFPLLGEMVLSALTLAALSAIDSLLTSLVADNVTRSLHDSDRELIGQGIGNTIAGLFGGLAGAGATMRTVVNVNAGGRTPLSGALHAVILLTMVLGAGSIAQYIPHAVLAGILIKVGTDIIDWDYLKRLHRAPFAGVLMMVIVLLVTVLVDLISAVALGMVMAAMVFLQRMVDLQVRNMRAYQGQEEEHPFTEQESRILKMADGRILLFHLSGPLSFGAAKHMIRQLARYDRYQVLVLDVSDVIQVDFTATRALIDIVLDARAAGRGVVVVGFYPEVERMLERVGFFDYVPHAQVYKNREDALREALGMIQKPGASPNRPGGTFGSGDPLPSP
ncbi:MAG TPA: SulP family inorganic anion transporter [Gammaproteobacteria bacterium]|nr:SulP family inorganic anion transporter [Gammaproteobacteria bacterium]